ncbi:MAG TPA: hypothetical protein PKC72_13365 [Chitinophagaceae bacterium]|nr:hypothetical protein [Chitinophagaceae bacterium]
MKLKNFYKFSSICSLLSGASLIIGWTLNIGRDSVIGAEIALAGYVLAIFAFVGIGTMYFEKITVFGFLGLCLIVLANILFIPWVFLDMARESGILPTMDWYYVERNGPPGIVAITGGAAFIFGYLAFGIDTIRAKVKNSWPSYLLILAALQPAFFVFTGQGKMLPRIAGVALLGFAWNLRQLTKK